MEHGCVSIVPHKFCLLLYTMFTFNVLICENKQIPKRYTSDSDPCAVLNAESDIKTLFEWNFVAFSFNDADYLVYQSYSRILHFKVTSKDMDRHWAQNVNKRFPHNSNSLSFYLLSFNTIIIIIANVFLMIEHCFSQRSESLKFKRFRTLRLLLSRVNIYLVWIIL